MIQAIQRRLAARNDEGGFTLIELMVVVMIIAILLGIAIPAFLGARSRAQDTAAKSNLRNALGAAQTRFSDQQVFEPITAVVGPPAIPSILTGLNADEPSLKFIDGSATGAGHDSTTAKEISVDTVPSTGTAGDPLDTIYLASYSKSGTCYYMRHANVTGATGGTFMTSAKVAVTLCTAKDGESASGYTAL